MAGIDYRLLCKAREGCPYEEGSEGYMSWWKEEIDRCINGYWLGGEYISGEYYFFLNYFKINRLEGRRIVFTYPRYCSADKEVFDWIRLAELEGKNIMIITGRGFGKSYIGAGILAHSYTFHRNSYNMIGVSISSHGERLWKKMIEGLDSMVKEMRHSRIKDKEDRIISGIEYIGDKGERLRKGFNSEVKLVVFNNDSSKGRGGRPRRVVFDEIGAWTGGASLKSCYNAVENSLYRGGIRTGIAILFGTGGEMHSGGSRDARDMYYNPTTYNLLSVDIGNNKKVCHFIPAYRKLEGFYDEEKDGEAEARNYLELKRKELLDTQDINAYEQYIQEMPFIVEEAFLIKSVTPLKLLRERLEQVELMSRREYNSIVKRGFVYVKEAVGDWWDINFKEDGRGKVQIVELPIWLNQSTGQVIEDIYAQNVNRYLLGCDSYDQDKSLTSSSQGALYVYDKVEGKFVAEYVDRPVSVEEFYENVLLLCHLYRGKVMLEHSKIGLIGYFKHNGMQKLLASATKVQSMGFRYNKASNKYGYSMDYRRKLYAVERYIEYCQKNKDKFIIKEQLYDHVHFTMESNEHDRTIASMLCIIYEEEMKQQFQEKHKSVTMPFWREENGKLVFR